MNANQLHQPTAPGFCLITKTDLTLSLPSSQSSETTEVIQCVYVSPSRILICSSAGLSLFNTEQNILLCTVPTLTNIVRLLNDTSLICSDPDGSTLMILDAQTLQLKQSTAVTSIKTHAVDTESLDIQVFKETGNFCIIQRVPLRTIASFYNSSLVKGSRSSMSESLLEKYDEFGRLVNYNNKIGLSFNIHVYNMLSCYEEDVEFKKYEIYTAAERPRYLCSVKSIGGNCCILAYNSKDTLGCSWDIFNEEQEKIMNVCRLPGFSFLKLAFVDLKRGCLGYFAVQKHPAASKYCHFKMLSLQSKQHVDLNHEAEKVILTPDLAEYSGGLFGLWTPEDESGMFELSEFRIFRKEMIYCSVMSKSPLKEVFGQSIIDNTMMLLHG